MEFAYNRLRSHARLMTPTHRNRWEESVWVYVALGGMLGTLSRYFVQNLLPLRSPSAFPLGTLLINLLGSLVLGVVLRMTLDTTVSPELRVGLAVGLCGGFTTMSAFAYETLGLIGGGQYARAGLYVLISVTGSVLAVAAGAAMAQKFV